MNKKEIPDQETTPLGQNALLRKHLDGVWSTLAIITIERMERQNPVGPSGWRAIHK